jgi:hypothetical protein
MYAEPCDKLKRENDNLRQELRDRQDEELRRSDQEYQNRQDRRERERREYRESLQYADDWPDAFQKGLIRIREEVNEEEANNRELVDEPAFKVEHFFADWEKQVLRARDIYREVMAEADQEISKIRENALAKVAERHAAEFGENSTAQALRENNPQFLTYW